MNKSTAIGFMAGVIGTLISLPCSIICFMEVIHGNYVVSLAGLISNLIILGLNLMVLRINIMNYKYYRRMEEVLIDSDVGRGPKPDNIDEN